MKVQQSSMSPLDVVVLLKIIALNKQSWNQKPLADSLFMSQSEISKSVARSRYSRLLDPAGKEVRRLAFMDFLKYGIAVVFPQQPGAVLRGIPTAHSAAPLNQIIQSSENYVWPSGKGTVRGHSIIPLYPSVVDAVQQDNTLYELLAMVDAIRVGRAREREFAINELGRRIVNGE